MRILIADDDLVNRTVLQKMLQSYGECDQVATGRDALAAFDRSEQEGRRYDLICLDIQMPEMDGQEVLRKIRDRERAQGVAEHKVVKIIMTTILDDSANVLQAFRAQCEAFLVKPIRKTLLEKNLVKLGLVGAAGSD